MTLLLAVAWSALLIYCYGQRISPDGKIYLQAGQGYAVPRPFHLRVLPPLLLGASTTRWNVITLACLVLAAVLVGALAGTVGASPFVAAALFVGLPIFRTCVELPVLVDAPALALTAGSALLAVTDHPALAVLVALVGGLCKEHVPIFAALAVMSPWPLIGLAAPLAVALFRSCATPAHDSQANPFAYAWKAQAPRLLDPFKSLLPWGVCLVALFAPSQAMWASLAVSYALLFVASDSARVYQWAAIPVCVQAATVIPPEWAAVAIVGHLMNPWRGDI